VENLSKRVVITGMGAVTPLGNDVDTFWKGIREGKCGIDFITNFDTEKFKAKLAAEVKGFDPLKYIEKKETRRMDRFCQFGIAAAVQAIEDSGLDLEKIDKERLGVVVGSGVGGLGTIEREDKNLFEKGPGRVSPMLIPMIIGNMAAGNIAIKFGAKGPCTTVVTACATGTNAIGDAFHMLQLGMADVLITGGAEASITPLGVAGFTSLTALSTSTDPKRASIPFDKERDGFIMGEGAGI
jgi:3-oxoacyl-[acyl-carrier-protein] synthase II